MSRVVFVARSSIGHINPTLSLVNELVSRGEEVFYLANDYFKELVEATGCVFLKSSKYLNLLYGYGASPQRANDKKRTEKEFIAGAAKFYDSTSYISALANRVKGFIARLKPDYIIHDSTMYFMKDIFRDSGIPCISTRAYFALNREIFYLSPNIFSDIFCVDLSNNIKTVIRSIDQMAHDSCLKHGHKYDYIGNQENLTIVFTSKEFQPYARLLDNTYHFAGNNLSFRRTKELIQSYRLSEHSKMILISFGSTLSGNQKYLNFYKNVMKHFSGFNALFVVNIGTHSEKDFEYIPDNFVLKNGINQLELLELADVFITHGGMNSASEALQLNAPMIVLPQSFDQFIVAEQIEKFGLGRQHLNPEVDFFELEQFIVEMLSNQQYLQNLNYIATTYTATGEEKVAVDRIFDFIGKN